MSKRPFIIQDHSPNILIVPTETSCEPPPKKIKGQPNETCEQPSLLKRPEYSSESMLSDDSVINTSGSSANKSEDSDQCTQSVNATERLKPSWASNYLLSIGDSHNPIKMNLSSTRKKIRAQKEISFNKKITKLTTPQIKEPKSQQKVPDESSCNRSKDILTAKPYPRNSLCSRPKTEYTYHETEVKSIKPLCKFDETKPTMKPVNTSNELKNIKFQYKETSSDKQYRDKKILPSSSKHNIAIPDKYKYKNKTDNKNNVTGSYTLYKDKIITSSTSKYIHTPTKYKPIKKNNQSTSETESDKRYSDKLVAPCTSKYVPTPNNSKLIKYDQNTNYVPTPNKSKLIKYDQNTNYVPTPNKSKLIKYDQNTNKYIKSKKDVNNSDFKTKTSGDKITFQPSYQSSKKNTVKLSPQAVKSKVLKKPSSIEKNDTTSYLYDLKTLKCKEFYANYTIPKISEKNKKQEPIKPEPNKDDENIQRLSAKDIFVKELEEAKCSTPVKSVVQVVDDSKLKADTNFDLRSKLSRRSLNHYFTKLRNLPADSATREQGESLLITIPNDTDEDVNTMAAAKRKIEDKKTAKKKEAKITTPKFKKIKLVIKVICEKSTTSSSDTDDEESLGDSENNDNISNLDLSFLDDFNVDEIVESLCKKDVCDLTTNESKDNAAKDFSFKYNADEINNNKDINITNTGMFPICHTDIANERSWLMDSDIKIENSLSNETLVSTDVTKAEINDKCNKANINTSYRARGDTSMKTSLADFFEGPKAIEVDERLRENGHKLITDSHNNEAKQGQHLQSPDDISMKKQTGNSITVKTEKESINTLTVSTISHIPKMAKEAIMCMKTKHASVSDDVPAVVESRKTDMSKNGIAHKASSENQYSIVINNEKTEDVDNYSSTDLIEETNGETIFAIRMFLENNTTLHLNKKCHVDNVDKTSNSIKEISTLNNISEINNTNSNNIEKCRNICRSNTKEFSEMITSINKPEAAETNKMLDKIKDKKKYHDNNKTPVVTNVGGKKCDIIKVKDNIEIKNMLYKNDIENKKYVQESSEIYTSNNNIETIRLTIRNVDAIEGDTYKIKDISEREEMLHKNNTEDKKDEVLEIKEILGQSEDIKKIQEPKHSEKTNVDSTERNSNKNTDVSEWKEMLHKNDIEDKKHVQESSGINTNNNRHEIVEINEVLGQYEDIKKIYIPKHSEKTNVDSTESNSNKKDILCKMVKVIKPDYIGFPLNPNGEIKKDVTEMKFEEATKISSHQSYPVTSSSLDEKAKKLYVCKKNDQFLSIQPITYSSEIIDLTNESDEESEAFQEKSVVHKNYIEDNKDVQEFSGTNTNNNKNEVLEIKEILGQSEDINSEKTNVDSTECNTNKNTDVSEWKEILHNNDIEDNKDVQESSGTNTNNNRDDVMEINEILGQSEDIKIQKPKHSETTNFDSTECNSNKKDISCKMEVKVKKDVLDEVITPDYTEFSLNPNGEVNKDVTEMKFEEFTKISSHQSYPVTSSQSLDEKAKKLNICNKNDKFLSIQPNTYSSAIIILTNESGEESEAFEEKCVVNADESFKTTENKQESANENVTEDLTNTTEYDREWKTEISRRKTEISRQAAIDESVTKTTKHERKLRPEDTIQAEDGSVTKTMERKRESKTKNSSQADNDKSITETSKLRPENSNQVDDTSVTKTIENNRNSKTENSSQAANRESITETGHDKGELRTDNVTQTDDASVSKTIKHKRALKTENSNQADNEYFTKSTEIKQKLKIDSSSKAHEDACVKKILEHTHKTEAANAGQTPASKIIANAVEESKENSVINVDLQETDVYLAKRLEDRMQQYLNKKHTITSLLHFGEFSKIYECVSENGEKYALKMMDGSKIYRNSKVEYLMKGLQRDVPKENYHCVYLFSGFGFTKHWCILMELYPKNLKQALQENKKSFHINVIQNLSRQLVSALTLLRHNNIVHTNIKPTHILVNSGNDQLKLCGFDEAQYKDVIQFSRNIGTMNYRAPEIILGHSADFKMDVWSTALVMYEMATNIQLFPGIVHNDILYKQMFVCGPVPCEMLRQSEYKNEHFHGLTFMRQLKGGKRIPVPYRIVRKHDLVKKYVYLTYKNDWHYVMSYKQKQQDYAKLQSFCQLLHQMLVIDPQLRLPIEFVYANPFLFDTNKN